MFNKSFYATLLVVFISSSNPAYAEHAGFEGHGHEFKPKVDNTINPADIAVLPNEAVIIVHGIVCSFCSQGVIRNLSKLSFIDKSKYTKGVKVEIEVQKVTIAITPGKKLNLDQVSQSILDGGYEPIEAYISNTKGEIRLHKLKEE